MVVGQNMRIHRILHEIVERSSREFIQLHDVLKIADLAIAPQIGYLVDRLGSYQIGQFFARDKFKSLVSILLIII